MEEATTGLNFEERGIANAIAQNILRVPLSQRSYAWTADEVQTLLDDLHRAFEAGESIYFLGMIVLTRGPKRQWEVADGQQRLATTSILIAAVRDYLLELGDQEGAQKYQSSYLLDYDPRKRDSTPKLYLNFEDHDYFLGQMLKPPADRVDFTGQQFTSHERLAKAAALCASQVRKVTAAFPEKEKAGRLYDWIDFLHEAAKVIIIMVPGRVGNAFKMFETLNARGMEASKTDILKNYLFDMASNKLGDVHPRWIAMLSAIEGAGEDDLLIAFIRHYWISVHGPTTERKLGEAVEDTIKSERQAVDMISSLASFAADYVAILAPRDHRRWNEYSRTTRDAIFTISRELRGEQIRPLMLAVSRYFDKREAEKAFSTMVSWSVRFLIAGGGGGGLLDRAYGLRAQEVTKGDIKTANELRHKMVDVVPNDEVFKAAFAIATVRRTDLARYYLRTLELHVKGERQPQLLPSDDTMAVNLEHVLPVTPSSDWGISPDLAAAFYRRIGNMVLLNSRENVELGNKVFSEKKAVLRRSPFVLTGAVAKYRKWGPDQIVDRQEELASIAPDVWPI